MTKEETDKIVKRLKVSSKSTSIEIDNGFLDLLMSDREFLKGFLIALTKKEAWVSAQIISSTAAREEGTQNQKQNAEARYQKTKVIFEQLNQNILPIKRSAIYSVIKPIWKTDYFGDPPREDTLFKYQNRYLKEG